MEKMKLKQMDQKQRIEYLTTYPVKNLVWQMAIPTIISMLISSFYNMADTYFVGNLGTQATGAVGVTFSMMTLIQSFGFFFGHGSGNYISRKLGAGEPDLASKMASFGFYNSFFIGSTICVFGIIFLEPLSLFLGSTPTILPYTIEYLGLLLLGTPFMMSSLVLNNQLRFQGSASFAMVGIVSGAILNIALDPFLIFTFELGIKGAALATSISQFVSFLILYSACKKGGNIKIAWKNYCFEFLYLKEMFKGGVPSLFRQGLGSVAQISLSHSAGMFAGVDLADAAIAGMAIVSRIAQFANSAIIGFGQGFQPICGMNYGAGKLKRVRETYIYCIKVSTLFLLCIGILGAIFSSYVVTIFQKDDPLVIEIGTLALRLQAIVLPLQGLIIMTNMLLQSIGKSVKASLLASARQGLFYLPLIWLLPLFFGISGIQATQPIADILAFILSLPLALSEMKLFQKFIIAHPEQNS